MKLLSNPLIRFLLIAVTGYLVWYLSYELFLKPHTAIDELLSYHLRDVAALTLELFGYSVGLEESSDMVILYLEGSHGVWIGDPCNGLDLWALFTIFILAFPGSWRKKAWFIPLGLLVIHFANIVRVVILTLISKNSPELLDFNHNYTFTITVYAIVFLLWYWWASKLSGITKQKPK